jgi:hypothetical protein
MVNFLLNGLNNTVTNTVDFTRTSAATETAIVAPTANLYMTASQWNTLFAYGNNIYRTYSGELPSLVSYGLNFTTTGDGTGAVVDYVTTNGSDQITAIKFANGGTRFRVNDTITFNMSSQGTSVDNVSASAYTLLATDLILGPLSRTLSSKTIGLPSGSVAAGQYVSGPDLDDGTFTDLLSYTYTGTSGAGAVLASVTISSNTITAATWSSAGSGYAAGDVFRISVDGTTFADYTIGSGDVSATAMQTLSPGTPIPKFITVAQTGGTGAVVNRVTVNSSNQITNLEFAEVGSGFSANNTLTVTINGTAFNAYSLANTDLTGSITTTALTGKTITFTNSTSAGDYANDVITIAVGGGSSGTGTIVDTVTVNASDEITAITFAGRGYGYAANETFTFTSLDVNGNSRESAAYTLLAADLNSDGSVKDISGKTIALASGSAYHDASIRINRRSLATVELSTPAGTALQEPEEVEQTIADNTIRWFMYGITGNYNQQGTFSNLETINTTIDNLLTGTANAALDNGTLDAALKTSINSANGLTDTNNTTANLSRQLMLQVSSGEAARLTANAFGQYHGDNILSNLVGVLTGITSTTGTYTTADGIAATFANGGAGSTGTNAELESITVRDNKVVGVKFSKPGRNYLASNTLTLTGSGLKAGTFTVDGASVGAVSGATAGTYTDITLTGGTTSGTGAKATVVVADATTITSITITTPGKGYADTDTVTIPANELGTGSAAVTLTLATGDFGTVTFTNTYTLVAGDLDNDGGLSNNLYNFTFEANDTLTFQVTVAPKSDATNAGQTSINYAAKITMI